MRLLLLSTVAFTSLGCGGAQRGQWSVSSSEWGLLADKKGSFLKIVGRPKGSTKQDELLVAVLLVGEFFSVISDTSESNQTYNSTIVYSTDVGNLKIEWNRQTDTIEIHGAKFDRGTGNVFIVRWPKSELTVEQVEAYVRSDETDAILKATKAALPDDSALHQLEALPTSD